VWPRLILQSVIKIHGGLN